MKDMGSLAPLVLWGYTDWHFSLKKRGFFRGSQRGAEKGLKYPKKRQNTAKMAVHWGFPIRTGAYGSIGGY